MSFIDNSNRKGVSIRKNKINSSMHTQRSLLHEHVSLSKKLSKELHIMSFYAKEIHA